MKATKRKVEGKLEKGRLQSRIRRAEEELRSSERQLSLIYSNVSDIIFHLAVEQDEHYRFLSVNPAFFKATGLTKSQVVGKLVNEIIPEPSLALVLGKYREAIRARETVTWEETSVYPTGTKHGEVFVTPIFDKDGRCASLIGAVHDVTERKQAAEEVKRLNEELEQKVIERTAQLEDVRRASLNIVEDFDGEKRLLQDVQRATLNILEDFDAEREKVAAVNQQLETANKELDAFSYSVSHDLRAPLRAIDGFSQALIEDYPGRLDEQGRHYLERVRAGTQYMARLIDDLLQLSRVARAEMRREIVDLSALADAAVADLRRAEPQRRVEVAIEPGLAAEGDGNLLRIALANLLANSWKFTARQPSARIELGAQDGGDGRAFYVRDNGAGFDMAYAAKLFGAFQRLHAASEFPGTGIGLATVQRIVARHGGTVWAEGAVNRGATFYFALPANRNA